MAKKEEGNHVSYVWKQFECEICKKPYPYVFKSNGNRFRLVDVDIPKDRNFLWLESLTFEKNSSRMVHVIMPDKDHTKFKMGRGHESDLRVSDIILFLVYLDFLMAQFLEPHWWHWQQPDGEKWILVLVVGRHIIVIVF